MGLAGAKKRVKLSHDPNNTAWSKSTDTFGHKILAAQGWKPGDFLGAENASHADHYTAANASHIRVVLREDNLGLGAQIGKGNAETFGLSMFSGLLGRLNGKVDTKTEAQRQAEQDAIVRIQHEQKYGFLNFVSGGFLVGDKMEPKEKGKEGMPGKTEKSKKRKHDDDDTQESAVSTKEKSNSKKEKSTPVVKADSDSSEDASSDEEEESNTDSALASRKSDKKEQRSKKSSKTPEEKAERAREKAEKRARKEERRKRKEEKRLRKAEKEKRKAQVETKAPAPVAKTPILSNGSRHATRQRYIQQKRMASMDPKALQEIFMLQAVGQ